MSLLLIATGGTIASRPTPEGVRSSLLGADLLRVTGIGDGEVEVLDLWQGPSWALTPAMVEHLARAVVTAAAGGDHDGVVITHGTDTLEESAFLTWLLGGAEASEKCPIVFTGAMHHADHPDADGPNNLRAAVEVAGAGGAPGPMVCIGGEVHHARWVRKTDTTSPGTFHSVGAGAPGPPPPPPPHGPSIVGPVAEVHAHAGIDAGLVDHLVEGGVRGLVVVGTGAGNVQAGLVPGIERAVGAGVPVVVTSRCWTGPVAAAYGGPGGGRTLADLGCILAGDLPTAQARLALWVALGVAASPGEVPAWFDRLLGRGS